MAYRRSVSFLSICAAIISSGLGVPQSFSQEMESVLGRITDDKLHGYIQFLADDLLEGRGPSSNGDKLTQLYLETHFRKLGLKKLNSLGSYRQPFPMLGLTSSPDKNWEFKSDGKKVASFQFHNDFVAVAGKPEPSISLKDAEVVFVGYGIQAPEYQWDDYKNVDLKGKVLLMLNNDPEQDPELFGGARRLYYGRWDYKFDSAARQGAAGAIIIHTDHSAGYPFTVIQTSWTGEEFELKDSNAPRMEMKAWLTERGSKELIAQSGKDWDELMAAAQKRDFKPVSLGVTISTNIQCEVRQRETANIVAALPGTDPKLKDQYVLFMAHHDHIGIATSRDEKGDMLYNGAIDNASGTAALMAIADAIVESGYKPKRSLLFVAVGAEEQGLLGSKYFAEHPPVPNGKQSAVVNIDGINFLGPTKDVHVVGFGKSSLDRLISGVAAKQNRVVVPDREPSKGYYYRSDQFSLAKVGVPGVYLHAGHEVIGKPPGWGKAELDAWTAVHYHQRSDEYNPSWNLKGAVIDLKLLTEVGLEAADDAEMQSWNAGDEFEAARKRELKAVQ